MSDDDTPADEERAANDHIERNSVDDAVEPNTSGEDEPESATESQESPPRGSAFSYDESEGSESIPPEEPGAVESTDMESKEVAGRTDGDECSETQINPEENPPALESETGHDDTQDEVPALESASSLSRAEDDTETTHERPLEELTGRIDERQSGTGDTPVDDLFDEESVDEVDPDRLWDELEGTPDGPMEAETEEREIRTISKRKYCHQCEFFTEPPVVECTNEGTEILEMPSMDSFRVVDCPKILEDEALEREHR